MEDKKEYPFFYRHTVVREPVNCAPIFLEPPEKKVESKLSVEQLLPSLILMLFYGLLFQRGGSLKNAILFGSMYAGIFFLSFLIRFFILQNKEKKRVKKDAMYLQEMEEKIKVCRKEEEERRRSLGTTPLENLKRLEEFSSLLFDRTSLEPTFLDIQIGSANQKAFREIQVPKREEKDPLVENRVKLSKKYELVSSVPAFLSLQKLRRIGFTGHRDDLYEMLKNVILDLSMRQFHTDFELFLLGEEEYEKKLKRFSMLPAFSKNKRSMAFHQEDSMLLLNELQKRTDQKPKIIISFLSREFLKHPLFEAFLRESDSLFYLFFQTEEELLPQHLSRIIYLYDEFSEGIVIDPAGDEKSLHFSYQRLDDGMYLHTVERLSPIYSEGIQKEMNEISSPGILTLLDLEDHQMETLSRRYEKQDILKSMAVPIGMSFDGEKVLLNLREQAEGPHGLVAGMTGSGKSELLLSYIFGIASSFPPWEVAFLLIDFKGGGLSQKVSNLPHVLGVLTDMDEGELERSLLSIHAEIKRREKLFLNMHVDHIDAYQKAFRIGDTKEPLPHLILLVDEFAELRKSQPAYMDELTRLARVGRSLGIHLILATQKPSGQISDQIWSNTGFQISLRVQTEGESREVLRKGGAEKLLKVGSAILHSVSEDNYTVFQTGYSGKKLFEQESRLIQIYLLNEKNERTLVYEKTVEEGRTESTEREVLLQMICNKFNAPMLPKLHPVILEPLKDSILYPVQEKKEMQDELLLEVGQMDDPENQRQLALILKLSGRNTLISGGPKRGKKNLVHAILRRLSEQYEKEDVAVYILDGISERMKDLQYYPVISSWFRSNQKEDVETFIAFFERELKIRKEKPGNEWRHFLLILSGMEELKIEDAASYERLLRILKEGIQLNISGILLTSSLQSIGFRYVSLFENKISFDPHDENGYGMLFSRSKRRSKNIPGRVLVSKKEQVYEAQIYDAGEPLKTSRNEENPYKIPRMPGSYTRKDLENTISSDLIFIGLSYPLCDPCYLKREESTLVLVGDDAFIQKERKRFCLEFPKLHLLDVKNERIPSYETGEKKKIREEYPVLYAGSLSDFRLRELMFKREDLKKEEENNVYLIQGKQAAKIKLPEK